MKMQRFEPRFSQNLAPVLQNKTLKPLPRLYFIFIQQTLGSLRREAGDFWVIIGVFLQKNCPCFPVSPTAPCNISTDDYSSS